MQVALHVGPLTDYFLAAIRRDAPDPDTPPAPAREEVLDRVLGWRNFVSEGLVHNGHVSRPIEWSEEPAPTWTFGLPADSLRALKLLLVHGADQSPPEQLPTAPEQHPLWVASAEAGFSDHPRPNILVPEFWLPGDYDFTFPCPYPDGHEIQTGWTVPLLAECRAVAEDLLIGGADAARSFADSTPPTTDDGLRALAAFGIAALLVAAERAVAHELPLMIHA